MKPKNLTVKENEAYIRNFKLSTLAERYGTPLFVFDEYELKDNIKLFKNNFKDDSFKTHIVYASKAFLVPALCNIISKEKLYMDSVSLGDLYVAYKSKFPLNHVVFHGNNKSKEELEFAVKHHVGIIVIDHYEELVMLERICRKENTSCNTMLRVNPGIDAHTHKYVQTALYVSKFGESVYDMSKIDKIIRYYKTCKYCKLVGFHSHIGSQILDVEPFKVNIERMMKFSKYITEKYCIELTAVNFGGGFGIKYQDSDTYLDKASLLKVMIEKIKETRKDIGWGPKDVYIEPGRSLLGESCVSLYTIGDFKTTYGNKNYCFVDGGMTDNIRPALYGAKYSVDVANRMNGPKTIKCDVAGKCCESGDIVAKDVLLPKFKAGDTLIVYSTASYTYSMASNYNNHLKPAVVFLGEKERIVARRETLDDLLRFF